MTGRSGEVVEVLVRRRVDICCVPETRWKGSGVRMVKGRQGQKYKFVWQGCPEGMNGVGVLFSEEFVDSVVSVTRVSDRLMMVKMMIGKLLVNVISGYAPQVGRSDEEKDKFWCALEKLMESVKDEEVVVVGGDLNGHVGRSIDGFEGVHGGYGYGVGNGEGERILEFADGADLLICNTQFQKEDNKLVTCTSGGSTTTVDYLMVRRRDRGHLRDTKVIPGEEAVSQHHLVVCDVRVKGARRARRVKYQPRMKVWRLKEVTVREALKERLSSVEDDVVELESGWMSMKASLLGAVGEVCGWTKGPPRHSETWWWDDEVGKSIDVKRKKFKEWQKAKGTGAETAEHESYKAARKAAKKEVAKAQEACRKMFGERLDSEEGQRAVFRIAKQIAKERCDVMGVSCLKDEVGQIVVDPDGIKGRWKR
uniref:craniofacial development protein 2-like n=1 Tax=Myxine glutinosa TaxID=7769 RepID=UPI00358F5306